MKEMKMYLLNFLQYRFMLQLINTDGCRICSSLKLLLLQFADSNTFMVIIYEACTISKLHLQSHLQKQAAKTSVNFVICQLQIYQ